MSSQDETIFPQWSKMEQVKDLPETEFNTLPFGAIQLDSDGKILRYNHTEAKISGRDPETVLGKNFFREIAPCTDVRTFAGRFREGVARKDLNAIFPYRFDFKMDPIDVWVRLFYSRATDTAWVFVTRRQESEG